MKVKFHHFSHRQDREIHQTSENLHLKWINDPGFSQGRVFPGSSLTLFQQREQNHTISLAPQNEGEGRDLQEPWSVVTAIQTSLKYVLETPWTQRSSQPKGKDNDFTFSKSFMAVRRRKWLLTDKTKAPKKPQNYERRMRLAEWKAGGEQKGRMV